VADAYEFSEENEWEDLDSALMCSLQNIVDTMEGYPVIPQNWKYVDSDGYEEQYSFPCIVDPANPHDNLLKAVSTDDAKKIKRKASITMDNLDQQNYALIFNRKGQTNFFGDKK
jgi:hypothetical protein